MSPVRRGASVVVGLAAVATLSACSTVGLFAVPAGDLGSPTPCEPEVFVGVAEVFADGHRHQLPTPPSLQAAVDDAAHDTRHGRAYAFTLDGTDSAAIVPPTGWVPARATDQEPRTYGFPSRPKDARRAAAWEKTYGHLRSVGPAPACREPNVSNG